MELNKEIKLSSRKRFDVSGIIRTQRILYFKDEGKIIIKSSEKLAIREIEKNYKTANFEVLSASKAARRYPKVFKNSSKKEFHGPTRTIILKVSPDMYQFCCEKGNITAYLRTLISREMPSQTNMKKICTLAQLAEYINEADEWPLDVEDIIEENDWVSDTHLINGVCHNEKEKVVFGENSKVYVCSL